MLGTREYTLCSPFRANAHNSSFLMYFDMPDKTLLRITITHNNNRPTSEFPNSPSVHYCPVHAILILNTIINIVPTVS